MNTKNFQSLLPKQVRKEVLNDASLIAVLLFGSAARDEHHRDIDLCFVLDKKYLPLEI